MTETTVASLGHSLVRPIKPGSVGFLMSGMEGKIIDVDTGSLLGPYERGEMCLKGPNIMKGYWNKPEATRNTIDEFGYLHTGRTDIIVSHNVPRFHTSHNALSIPECIAVNISLNNPP